MSNGLWDYDDDAPPVAPHLDSPEVVVVDEEDKRRGRKVGSKKAKTKPLPKPPPEVIDLVFSDDEEEQKDVLVMSPAQHQHANKRRKTGDSIAAPSPVAATKVPAPAPDPRFTKTVADCQNLLASIDQALHDESEEEQEESTSVDPSSMEPSMRYRMASMQARARTHTQANPDLPHVNLTSQLPAADVNASKYTIKCNYQGGKEPQSVRVLASDTVSALISAFIKAAGERGIAVPHNTSSYKVDFDGEYQKHSTTIEEVGLENDDIVDISWRA